MALETDPHRLEQRQKQIDFGLATTGYANYVSWLKTNKGHVKPIPIPNIYIKCSKRSWDGQIRHWRRLLHLWDAIELPTGTPEDRHFQDPCAGEKIEYQEVDVASLPEPTRGPPPGARPLSLQPPRLESPTALSSSSHFSHPDSPHHLARSSSDEFSSVYAAQNTHPYLPSGHRPTHQLSHHPYALPPPPQPLFQGHHHMVAPVNPGLNYVYPPMPPPGWQLSYVPTGYPPFPMKYASSVAEEPIAAELLLVAEQETAARTKIVEMQSSSAQDLLFKGLVDAVQAASAAQKGLAQRTLPRDTPAAWAESNIGMLMNTEFVPGIRQEVQGSNDLLPPSLAEPVPRQIPGTPAAASDSHSLNSFIDLSLDEERYNSFRRHFAETSSTQGLGSLETPPSSWSPARFTPSIAARRGAPAASSPGLTPSPHNWFVAQQSPVQDSPRAALAFTDWASPHPGKPQEPLRQSTSSDAQSWTGRLSPP